MNRPLAVTVAAVFVAVLGALAPAPAQAQPAEARTYFDLGWRVLHERSGALDAGLSPFLEELRFQAQGLAYRKLSAGTRLRVLSWLSVQAYYARTTSTPAGKPASSADLLVGNVILSWKLGPLTLKNREGNEWHVTQAFYRYRNLVEGSLATPLPWLSVFLHEEIRIDADQGRVNMNNVGGGVKLGPWHPIVLRVFLEAESNRRSKPTWQTTPYVGLSLAAHF